MCKDWLIHICMGVDHLADQNKLSIENEIISLVKEAMKSDVSKEEFSHFLKNKFVKKMDK